VVERGLPWPAEARLRRDFVVRRLREREEIRRLLRPRLEYAAYALGQLEPGLFERTRWYTARGETGTAVVAHSHGGLGEATFVMGDPDAALAILAIDPGGPATFATCQPVHLDAMARVYRLSHQQPMVRMAVRRETFRPYQRFETVRLTGLDVRRVNALYSTEGGATYYAPEHLDAGLYRGVVVEGKLVAIAGTHVVSPQERVAVVGNVFTHPAYRGRGYAKAATSAVTEALLELCDVVVLTVDPRNRPAVAAYRQLGYTEVCELVEASATRRDLFGVAAAWRRLRAAFRGRRYGGYFVSVDETQRRSPP
jgi:ribosomal protein S18 acetylase RimI-like enzyme